MSLLALSDEVLLEIAEWVGTDAYLEYEGYVTDRGTKFLSSLVICSRRLNQIATPVLYRTFVQTKKEALPAFLRTLLLIPRACALVKKFVVSEIEEEESMDMLGFSREDLSRLGLGAEVIEYLEREKPNWSNELEDGKWQAVVALLLLILPSLEEIEIASCRGPELTESQYIDTALSYAAAQQLILSSQYSLRNLKTVSMAWWDREYGMSMNVILPFCSLPSVLEARIHMAIDESFPPSPIRYGTQDLQLSYSNLECTSIVNVLACFPSLKKLYYENGGTTVGYGYFLPQYLGQGIQHLKGCLEELTVLDQENEFWGGVKPGPIGSLAEFKKLRIVATYYDCLLKEREPDPFWGEEGKEPWLPRLVEVLPGSLEALAVSQCEPDILGQVQELLQERRKGERSNFLALKKIIISFAYKGNLTPLRDLEVEVIADGKEMGVEVVIVYPDSPRMAGSRAELDAAFRFDGVKGP